LIFNIKIENKKLRKEKVCRLQIIDKADTQIRKFLTVCI